MFAPDPSAAAVVLPLCPLHEMYAEPAREFIDRARRRRPDVGAGARQRRAAGGSKAWRCAASVLDRGRRGRRRAVVRRCAALFGAAPPASWSRCSTTRRRHGGDADRDGEPVVRPAGHGRRSSRACPAGRCSGCSTSGWRSARSASHLSLVVERRDRRSSATTNDELSTLAAREVEASLPGARGHWPMRATVVREKQATFSLAPGPAAAARHATRRRGLVPRGRLDRHGSAGDDRGGGGQWESRGRGREYRSIERQFQLQGGARIGSRECTLPHCFDRLVFGSWSWKSGVDGNRDSKCNQSSFITRRSPSRERTARGSSRGWCATCGRRLGSRRARGACADGADRDGARRRRATGRSSASGCRASSASATSRKAGRAPLEIEAMAAAHPRRPRRPAVRDVPASRRAGPTSAFR